MSDTPSTEERTYSDDELYELLKPFGNAGEYMDGKRYDLFDVVRKLLATTAKASEEGDELVWLQNRCPACKRKDLFVGKGAWITCANVDCPQPDFERASEEAIIEKIRPLLVDETIDKVDELTTDKWVRNDFRADLRKALNIDPTIEATFYKDELDLDQERK